jgi:integrase
MAPRRLPPGVRLKGERFQVRYRDPEGRQRGPTFASAREAVAYQARIRTELAAGSYQRPEASRVTVAQWARAWQKARSVSRSTAASDEWAIERWILPAFGSLQLRQVTRLGVQAWVVELQRRELAPPTIDKALVKLKMMMTAAVEEDLLRKSPCVGVSSPPATADERVFLTPTVFAERLLPEAPDRYRALVLLAYTSGLRWSELAGLRRRRLDLVAGHVEVVEVLEEIAGTRPRMKPPKSRASRRIVKLPRATVEDLERHLLTYPVASGDDLVFTRPAGGPLSRTAFRGSIWVGRPGDAKRAPLVGMVVRAGLDPAPRFHDLRHSHAAALIATGASPLAVSRRLGHGSVRVTYDIYGHLLPDVEDQLMAGLESQLSGLIGGQVNEHPDLLEVAEHLDAMYGERED